MKAILSPWAYFPLHVGHSFALTKWMGSGNGSIGQLAFFAFNIIFFLSEHMARSFPDLAAFDARLHNVQYYVILPFFYFSYYNCGNDYSLVLNWFLAFIVFVGINSALGLGSKSTMGGHMEAIENDSAYNIAHLVEHCFIFIMARHVASVVDVTLGVKKGWLGEYIKKHAKSWQGAAANPLYTLGVSLAVCLGTIIFAVSVELMRADGGSVPFFPPMCRAMVDEEDECTFMGITIPCFKVFKKETVDHFGMGLEMDAIWTFLVTFLIGFVSMFKVVDAWRSGVGTWKNSSLKITCAVYAMETALFALIRFYWGVCKPLVVAAAVHNLCEWSIVLHMVANHEELNKYLPSAAFFITFLSTLCMCVPNLFISLGLEQSFGIMLDFGMPMMFSMQLFCCEKRRIYFLPATAHTVHLFGTILPLVFSILLSNHVSWFSTFFLEILINVTVPAAHFIYCYWSFDLESILTELHKAPPAKQPPVGSRRFTTIRFSLFKPVDHDDVPSVVDVSTSSSEAAAPLGGRMKVLPREPSVRWKTDEPDEPSVDASEDDDYSFEDDDGLVPPKYRIHKFERYLVLGFLFGGFTLAYIPLMYMPECSGPPCLTQRFVSKTSILTLSEESLESGGTVKEAQQSQPGLIDLKFGRAHHDVSSNKYFMVEEWKAKDNMTATEGIISRFTDTSALIEESTLKQLDVATVNSMTCSSERIDSIELQPQYSCKKLWRVLDSPGYCAWIPGCKIANTESSHHAKLFMADGTTLPAVIAKNRKEKKIGVSVLSPTELHGYSAVMSLKEKSGKGFFSWLRRNKSCNLKYDFRINVSWDGSDNFHEYFLPDLYTKLSQ
ncbi:hypothetical protein QTG54_011750 [Skeletonema marinoi]|uniref:Uncharacterized protein n=2 Tax=Skeletonema marinoi TaxID=267567 RepID=A0AAD8Y1G8_9STRA|nr:hypothetical protein QTG54_011750 [Skeletonema marinoi]